VPVGVHHPLAPEVGHHEPAGRRDVQGATERPRGRVRACAGQALRPADRGVEVLASAGGTGEALGRVLGGMNTVTLY